MEGPLLRPPYFAHIKSPVCETVRVFTGTGAFLLLLFCQPAVGASVVDYWPSWVTKITTDSATINWRGDNLESASVEYATESYYKEHHSFQKRKIIPQIGGSYKHVLLMDLE